MGDVYALLQPGERGVPDLVERNDLTVHDASRPGMRATASASPGYWPVTSRPLRLSTPQDPASEVGDPADPRA